MCRDKRVLSKDSKKLQRELNEFVIAEMDKKLKKDQRKLKKIKKIEKNKRKEIKQEDFTVNLD